MKGSLSKKHGPLGYFRSLIWGLIAHQDTYGSKIIPGGAICEQERLTIAIHWDSSDSVTVTADSHSQLPMYATALNTTSPWRAENEAGNISLYGVLLLILSLFIVSFASIKFTSSTNSIAILWPSNAILFAVLFRAARDIRNKVLILLSGGIAIVLANLADGDTLPLSVALATANVAEVATACWLLNRFRDASPDITRVRSLAFFILLAGGAAPLVSATIGATAVVIDLRVPFSEVWLTWYTANALGMTIVAPFALLINSEQWRELRLEKRIAEAIGILVLIAFIAFSASFNRAFFFMVVPVVLIATFRFGVVGAAAGILVIAVVGNICIALGIAPPIFALATIPERILTLQFFLAATAIWALPVAAVLLERDRLVAELTAGKSEAEAATETKSRMVKSLQRHLWNAEERERLRLAHELHDQTGQSLVAAMMELNELHCHVTGDKCDRLSRVREQLDGVGETLRRVAWELRPSSLDDFGLAQALENHLVDWGERCSIEVDFDCSDPDIDRLPDDIRTTIYRVVQESLTNVAKHAKGANSVSIILDRKENMLRLMIEDDGCGFSPELVESQKLARTESGLGLVGMRERLSFIGGELQIVSSVGIGTAICARIRLDA